MFFFWKRVGSIKILTDFGLHSFLTQLEKPGLQIRRSSAEHLHFLLQVEIPYNQKKWCVQGQSLLGAKNHQATHTPKPTTNAKTPLRKVIVIITSLLQYSKMQWNIHHLYEIYGKSVINLPEV